MRLVIVPIMIVAACGGGTDDGAILTVRAPVGPVTASRIEIILASADASTIVELGQRATPTELTEEAARYYRQRATAGSVDDVAAVNGFSVRIEANADASADQTFIPFLITYDRDANNVLQLSGIGAVLDEAGAPAEVVIKTGKTESYFVDMVALTATTGEAGIASGESMVIDCPKNDQQATYRSGIAWRSDSGPQLRLLLPDLADDGVATDASERPLDLDCDLHEAPDHDCDDLRGRFHDEGVESCDGVDTNCDGSRIELMECSLAAGVCGPNPSRGSAVCLDVGAGQMGQCAGDARCQCASGNPGTCTKCVLAFEATVDANTQLPCAPAVGKLSIGCEAGDPCTVQVVPIPGPWEAKIALLPTDAFGQKATGVTDVIHLQAKFLASDLAALPTESVGEIVLAVTNGEGTRHIPIDLQLSNLAVNECPQIGGVLAMQCSP